MATNKARITISLDDHAYEVIQRLARANKRPMSAVITEFLQLVQPQMERVVSILEAAAKAPTEAHQAIKASLDRAESALLPTIRHALLQRDMLLDLEGVDVHEYELDQVERAAPKLRAKRGPGRVAAGGQPPVPVTRGVGTPKRAKSSKPKGARHG